MRTTPLRFGLTLMLCRHCRASRPGAEVLCGRPLPTSRSYHTYEELAAALKAAVAAHPDLAKLVSIGKTREGRDIWAVEIAKPSGPPVDTRPGLLIAATFEGDHLIGSELALYTVDFLLSAYATDAAVKQRLERSVVYVVPRVNVDGAEQMFAPVKALRRTNTTPFDADNDGRTDEDGPEDLNKDGVVTVMRVKDPKGPYMVSPEDARLMKRADPAKGESGGWALYSEGIDNDGDGFYNEDGPGGVDINRNFMHQYPYFSPDAGRYMVSETETRALLDYVLEAPQHRGHPDLRRKRQPHRGGRTACRGRRAESRRLRRARQRAGAARRDDARSRRSRGTGLRARRRDVHVRRRGRPRPGAAHRRRPPGAAEAASSRPRP